MKPARAKETKNKSNNCRMFIYRMSTATWYILTKQTVACTMAYSIRHICGQSVTNKNENNKIHRSNNNNNENEN